jgi:hypothetical protein
MRRAVAGERNKQKLFPLINQATRPELRKQPFE